MIRAQRDERIFLACGTALLIGYLGAVLALATF